MATSLVEIQRNSRLHLSASVWGVPLILRPGANFLVILETVRYAGGKEVSFIPGFAEAATNAFH